MGHQAGIHANHLELIDARLAARGFERLVQFHQEQVITQPRDDRDAAALLPAVIAIRPAAGPANAVVREDQRVAVGGVVLCCPDDKISQRVTGGHVHFAQVIHHIRANAQQVIILAHVVAPRAGPVAIALVAAAVAVYLRNDVDPVGRADLLHLVEVEINILLQNLVVRVLIEHHRPGAFASGGRWGSLAGFAGSRGVLRALRVSDFQRRAGADRRLFWDVGSTGIFTTATAIKHAEQEIPGHQQQYQPDGHLTATRHPSAASASESATATAGEASPSATTAALRGQSTTTAGPLALRTVRAPAGLRSARSTLAAALHFDRLAPAAL